MDKLARLFGTFILPYTNSRVVCPPGRLKTNSRPNIIVATPRRSGTHILIDLILNNISDYRSTPLYVDLDRCFKRSRHNANLLESVTPNSGYILKTHMPSGVPETMMENNRIRTLVETACVVTVHRDREDVIKSMMRWKNSCQGEVYEEVSSIYDCFWRAWNGRSDISIRFEDLFVDTKMREKLSEIAAAVNCEPPNEYIGPLPRNCKNQIYLNKLLTRLLGAAAPRIDTTIHTLK